MKNLRLLFLLFLQILSLYSAIIARDGFGIRDYIAQKVEKYQEERNRDEQIGKFLYRYGAPYKVQREVDAEMTDEVKEKIHKDGFAVLSSYVVKDGSRFFPDEKHVSFYRLLNAIRMQRVFKKHGIDDLWAVPDKYWSTKYNMVIAKKVRKHDPKMLPFHIDSEVGIESRLIECKTGFADWHPGNLFYDVDSKKYTFIDTGCESFRKFLESLMKHRESLSSEDLRKSVSSDNLIRLADGVTGTDLLKKYAGTDNLFDINMNMEKYDDSDIDFRGLKKHLDEHDCLECNYDRYKEFFHNFDCN